MTKDELREMLASHRRWLDGDPDSKPADLRCANLCRVNLCRADLRGADLSGADLSGADLRDADLIRANLRDADLSGADLSGADLRDADLRGAPLSGADLRDADLDYSAWPLMCDSLEVKIDKRIAAQLLYHALRAMQSCADEPDVAAVLASEPCLKLANQFHRVSECGRIEPPTRGVAK